MLNDPDFDFVQSWEHHGNPTRWLRAHQDTLRATAAAAGWDHVAEALEAKGWSLFWKRDRPMTGLALARQMALIAFRSRKAGPRRDRQTNLRAAVTEAVKDAIVELAAAGALPIPVASPASSPTPPARGVFAAAAADMAARKTGEIKISNAPAPGKRLVLDPSLQARAVAGVADDFEIPNKKTEK
jgi:hypothetical protein